MEEINKEKYECESCGQMLNELEVIYNAHGSYCLYCHGPVKEIDKGAE